MTDFIFEIVSKSKKNKARRGRLHTPHGVVETPVFMPVGTQATVKGLTPQHLNELSTSILLANTYHLALRPGIELIKTFGGLHDFMGWQGPILTDSGGYQVFSLAQNCHIENEGVTFQSHIDGSRVFFSPESVLDLQFGFNSDIMMPLDVCSPYPCSMEQVSSDMALTHAWAKRAKTYWESRSTGQWLFAIVQGGMYADCRHESARILTEIDFPGYALGGISVGEPPDVLKDMLALGATLLPECKPRYAMGIGLPENLSWAISQGIDMFDCVLPTRLARHGQFFMKDGSRRNIANADFVFDKAPLVKECACYTCKHFSRAYLRHVFKAKEMISSTLLSIHNIHFLQQLVKDIRESL